MLLSMLGEKPGARALAPLNVLVDLLVPGGGSVSYRFRIVVILGIIKVTPAIILMLTSDIKSGLQTVTRTEFHKMAKYANTWYAMLRPCIVLSEQPT